MLTIRHLFASINKTQQKKRVQQYTELLVLLVVDIGNTNICFGVFNDDVLEKVLKVSTDLSLTVEQYQDIVCGLFNNYKINHCIIASVVKNLDETLKKACDNVFDINSLIFDNNLFLFDSLIIHAYSIHILFRFFI